MMSKKVAAIVVSVMWAIWSNRNKYTHGEAHYQPLKSMELVNELLRALELPPEDKQVVRPNPKWKPPESGWVKINTDGAIDQANGSAGAGLIARGEGGNFIFAECRKYFGTDPFLAELLACRDAIQSASVRNIDKVCVETDCQAIVTAWHSGCELRFAGVHILNEMKMFSLNFHGFKLVFVHREANKAAHTCARQSFSLCAHSSSFDMCPGFLNEVVHSELVSSLE
jgi:ribonuclease HI